jgi:hypothetical protein
MIQKAGEGQRRRGREQRQALTSLDLGSVARFQEALQKGPKGKKIRYGAKCIHCHKEYSALSSGGTSHLTHRRDKCVKRHEKTRMSQS